MPIAPCPIRTTLLPRFDTLLMTMELRSLEKQLINKYPDGVDLSSLNNEQDALLFENIHDKMPIAVRKRRLSLTDSLLFPTHPKSIVIIPKRLSLPSILSGDDFSNPAENTSLSAMINEFNQLLLPTSAEDSSSVYSLQSYQSNESFWNTLWEKA